MTMRPGPDGPEHVDPALRAAFDVSTKPDTADPPRPHGFVSAWLSDQGGRDIEAENRKRRAHIESDILSGMPDDERAWFASALGALRLLGWRVELDWQQGIPAEFGEHDIVMLMQGPVYEVDAETGAPRGILPPDRSRVRRRAVLRAFGPLQPLPVTIGETPSDRSDPGATDSGS